MGRKILLLARITRLPQEIINQELQAIVKRPNFLRFNECRYQSFTVQSGVSSTSLVLSGLVGKVNSIWFVVRPVSGLTGNNLFSFTEIKDFSILNSSGTNISSGQVTPSRFALLQIGNDQSKSSYLAEPYATTPYNSFLYVYSFAADLAEQHASAGNYSHYEFRGQEQLQINFATTLAANYQVDVWGSIQSGISQSLTNVRKETI